MKERELKLRNHTFSVRTLHYYHEIGLLPPTEISEAGYRLYGDKALEILRRITGEMRPFGSRWIRRRDRERQIIWRRHWKHFIKK